MIHKDCFAYGEKPSGKPDCAALTKINCAGCKFYKTKKQAKAAEKRRMERLQRIGMWEADRSV